MRKAVQVAPPVIAAVIATRAYLAATVAVTSAFVFEATAVAAGVVLGKRTRREVPDPAKVKPR